MDFALSVATGTDWHGHEVADPRNVLLVLSEGRKGYARRVASWVRYHAAPESLGFRPNVLEALQTGKLGVFRHEEPLWLDPSGENKTASQTLQRLRQEAAARDVGLLVFDVFSDFAPGIEENSRAMGHTLKLLAPDRFPGTPSTIAVHHEGYSNSAQGRARGHSSLQGIADVRIAVDILAKDDDDRPTKTVIRLRNPKQKDEDPFRPIGLIIQKPYPELPAPLITGATAIIGAKAVPGVGGDGQLTANQRAVLRAVCDLLQSEDRGRPSEGRGPKTEKTEQRPDALLVSTAEIIEACRLPKTSAGDALNALVQADYLHKPKRGYYSLAPLGEDFDREDRAKTGSGFSQGDSVGPGGSTPLGGTRPVKSSVNGGGDVEISPKVVALIHGISEANR